MKHFITLFITGLLASHSLHASDDTLRVRADSVMRLVIRNASLYEHVLDSYEADVYVKGETQVRKKNFLMHFAHLMFPVEHNPTNTVFEMLSHSGFKAPGNYRHDIEAVNGNRLTAGKKYKEVLTFVNINVYAPTIYNKEIITPMAANAFHYYNFRLESVSDTAGLRIYNIRFTPRRWSQKLLTGNLHVTDKAWTIDRIEMSGHSSFSDFSMQMSFGRERHHFILPEKADLQVRFGAPGNEIICRYHSSFRYNAVAWVEEDEEEEQSGSLDLTRYFSLSSDTIPIVRDTAYWATRRDSPLTKEEASVYSASRSGKPAAETDSSTVTPYLRLGERLTSTVNLDYKTTRVKYSGLFNPFQLAFSGKDGMTYRQQVRISKTFAGDRQLRFHPEIGYMFKRKEVRFKVAADWEYMPRRRGAVGLTLANGNQSYSSEIIREVNDRLEDLGSSFDDLHLKPFHHYYARLHNNIEVANGLQLGADVSYHRRVPRGKHLDGKFHDFTPAISLTWTPRLYYWMDGHRKEYLYSHYPTFSVEVARGIPGVMGSTGNYGRVEASVHQSIRTGLSERMSYHLSGGLFFDQRSTYFADFRYFAKKYFPETWGDRFGGVFHNLEGGWYNTADKYVQGHFLYESPFILLQLLKPAAHKYLLSERFYLSQLWTPVLPCYTELGYGVGSDLFNIAVFAGFEKGSYRNIGVKFALELFQ